MQLLRRARIEDDRIYDDGIKYMQEILAKTVLCVFVVLSVVDCAGVEDEDV